MDLLINWLTDLYYQYPLFCYLLGAVLLLLLIWKPAKLLKFAFLVLVLLGILYVAFTFINSAKTGAKYTKQGIEKSEKGLE